MLQLVILSFKMILQILEAQNINWRKSGKLGNTCYILITDNNWPELKQKVRLCKCCGHGGSCCVLNVTVTALYKSINVVSLHVASSRDVSSQAAELEKFSYSHILFVHSWLRQHHFYKKITHQAKIKEFCPSVNLSGSFSITMTEV